MGFQMKRLEACVCPGLGNSPPSGCSGLSCNKREQTLWGPCCLDMMDRVTRWPWGVLNKCPGTPHTGKMGRGLGSSLKLPEGTGE